MDIYSDLNKIHDYRRDPSGSANQRESAYEDFNDDNPDRMRGQSSSGRPKLPTRTPESKMLISEAPPALPDRTEASYQTIEVEESEMQAYEAVNAGGMSSNSREHSEVSHKPVVNSNNPVKNKARALFDKTTNAFAKVGSSMGKSAEDENSSILISPPDQKKASYNQEPAILNGQDISFPKRLMKKIKGSREMK